MGKIQVPEGFYTVKEFAEKYGITIQSVSKNCKNEKYPGAFQDPHSGRWYIPKDTEPLKRGGAREGAGVKPGTNTGPKLTGEKVGRKPVGDKRVNRHLKANNQEWQQIEEKAAQSGLSVNEYIIRKALDIPLEKG